MRINVPLSPEDQQLLENLGVVFKPGEPPHFQKKEAPVPAGMIKLSSGRLVPYTPIEECLTKW